MKKTYKKLKLKKTSFTEEGVIKGVAIVTNSIDSDGDAFAEDLKISTGRYPVYLYKSHDNNTPYASDINETLKWYFEDGLLKFEAKLNLENTDQKNLWINVKDGLAWGVSCGFYINDDVTMGTGLLFKEITLLEISITHIPAEIKTFVGVSKSKSEKEERRRKEIKELKAIQQTILLKK